MLRGKVSNFLRTSRFSSIDKTILFGVLGLLLMFSVPDRHGISAFLFAILTALITLKLDFNYIDSQLAWNVVNVVLNQIKTLGTANGSPHAAYMTTVPSSILAAILIYILLC